MADEKKKTFSADDVMQAWAEQLGKLPTEFGVQSFENKDGEHSVALVNLETKSLVAQANGADEQSCLNRLGENAVVTFLDNYVAPKEGGDVSNTATALGYGTVETQTFKGVDNVPAQENVEGVTTNQDVVDNFPKNDNGQVEIDESGRIKGLSDEEQPLPGNVDDSAAGAGSAPAAKSSSTSKPSK